MRKGIIDHQGEVMSFSWTEPGFMMDCPEGITLRINLTPEKKIIVKTEYKDLIRKRKVINWEL